MRALSVPGGPSVRDDRGVAAGFDIPVFYDSLISKLVVWGETRQQAIATLTRALDEYRVVGVKTTLPFFRWLVRQPAFTEGQFGTSYLDGVLSARRGEPFVDASDIDVRDATIVAALAAWFRAHRASSDEPALDRDHWRRAARLESLR